MVSLRVFVPLWQLFRLVRVGYSAKISFVGKFIGLGKDIY